MAGEQIVIWLHLADLVHLYLMVLFAYLVFYCLANCIVSSCHVYLYDRGFFLVCAFCPKELMVTNSCFDFRVFGSCGLISLYFYTAVSCRTFKTACSVCWRHATQQGSLYWKFWISTTGFLCLSAGTCISSLWVCPRGSSLCTQACQYILISNFIVLFNSYVLRFALLCFKKFEVMRFYLFSFLFAVKSYSK